LRIKAPDASQWQPNLFRNTTAIYPFQNNAGWNLETAMADEAIHYGCAGERGAEHQEQVLHDHRGG
jgi:hypothetical protein